MSGIYKKAGDTMLRCRCTYARKGQNLLMFTFGFLSAIILPYKCLLTVVCIILMISAIILLKF